LPKAPASYHARTDTASPSPPREGASPYQRIDSPFPAPTAEHTAPPPKPGPSINRQAIVTIPKTQILCCKAIRPTSKAEKPGHDDLVTFVRSFCGKEVKSISSIKNVYGVIWQEYNFIVGINMYNPNTKTLEVKFYGGEEFSKGTVEEIAPPTRPIVVTQRDAEDTNEECLIRVDCGVDFNCKTHGHWRFTAFYVRWQAPGEKDRRDKQEERLRNKRKRSSGSFNRGQQEVPTANQLFKSGGMHLQMDGADEYIGGVGGGYVFSEDLFATITSSSSRK
jgi:hypothetical protein